MADAVVAWVGRNKGEIAASGVMAAAQAVLLYLYKAYKVWKKVPPVVEDLKSRVEAIAAFGDEQLYVLDQEKSKSSSYYNRFEEAVNEAAMITQKLYEQATSEDRSKDYALALVGLGANKQLKVVEAINHRLDSLLAEMSDRNLLAVASQAKQTTDILREEKAEKDQVLAKIQNAQARAFWRENFGRVQSVSWSSFADALLLAVCKDVEHYLSVSSTQVQTIVDYTIDTLKPQFDSRNTNEVTVFRYAHITRDRSLVQVFNAALQEVTLFTSAKAEMQAHTPTRTYRASAMVIPSSSAVRTSLGLPSSNRASSLSNGITSSVSYASYSVQALTDGPLPDRPATFAMPSFPAAPSVALPSAPPLYTSHAL